MARRAAAALLVCWVALRAGPVPAEPPCAEADVETARRDAKVLSALGKDLEAAKKLAGTKAACAAFLACPRGLGPRLTLAADLAAAWSRAGEPKKCLDAAAETAPEFPSSGKKPALSAPWKALAAAYRLCGCPDVREPLCREGSWLKKGYAEAEMRLRPSDPPLRLRLVYAFEEVEKRSAAGTPFLERRARPAALEISGGKGAPSRLPIAAGEAESGASSPPDFIPPREEKDNFLVADMNFDGYADVAVPAGCGSGGCCAYNHWLYSPAQGRFVFSEALAGVCFPEFDRKEKIVRAAYRAGPSELGSEAYQWKGEKLSLIERITETASEGGGPPRVKVERLVNGRLREVPAGEAEEKGAKLTRPFLEYRR